MSPFLEALILVAMFTVRIGFPIAIICFVCCALRRCERRWDAEAARLRVSGD